MLVCRYVSTSHTIFQGTAEVGSSLQDLKKAMELLNLAQQGSVKTTEDAMAKQYEFWNTQPVPKISKSRTFFFAEPFLTDLYFQMRM